MNFEGVRCPWCGSVTMCIIEYYDMEVIGTCNECGRLYKAKPHPNYPGAVVISKMISPINFDRSIKTDMHNIVDSAAIIIK